MEKKYYDIHQIIGYALVKVKNGIEYYTNFPIEETYCLNHIKKQERKNNYYNTL
jgi:hypothetical protein